MNRPRTNTEKKAAALAMKQHNELLDYLLADCGYVPQIGVETGLKPRSDGIARYISRDGAGLGASYRYVAYLDGVAVAAVQVMVRREKPMEARIANVFTAAFVRRRGYATRLLERVRQDFTIVLSREPDTTSAVAWVEAMLAADRIDGFISVDGTVLA